MHQKVPHPPTPKKNSLFIFVTTVESYYVKFDTLFTHSLNHKSRMYNCIIYRIDWL